MSIKQSNTQVLDGLLLDTETWGATHRQQHTPALPHGSAAAQEADDQQEGPHADEQVTYAGQVGQLSRSVLHSLQDAKQRGTVHRHPDSHTQDDGTRQLYGTRAQGNDDQDDDDNKHRVVIKMKR